MRRIRTVKFQAATPGGGTQIDSYFDRVVKYIPADVVGAWIAVTGIINGGGIDAAVVGPLAWIAFAVGLIFSGLWTWRQTSVPGQPTAALQIVLAVGAFVVWVFALGGPFVMLSWYSSSIGSLALIGYTLFSGLLVPRT